MKQILKIALLVVSLVMLFTNAAMAQNSTPLSAMPMSLSIAQEGVVGNNALPLRVNVKAVRHFNKHYNGRQAEWYQARNEYIAKFAEDSIRTVIGYAKQGRWLYTIKHYGEDQMPRDLRHLIKSEYYDFDIQLINEVVLPTSKSGIYLVHLVNNAGLHYILRYSDEGIETVKKFQEYRSSELGGIQPATKELSVTGN